MVRCGPKMSIAGMVIGAWGVIMLSVLGLFFRMNSPALAEDIPKIPEHVKHSMTAEDYKDHVYANFRISSNNCFIAAGIYVFVTVASVVNYKVISVKGTTATA